MPRVIVKCGYMKPNSKNRAGFVEYIAKREGAIKILENISNKPATKKQMQLITQLKDKFPGITNTEEYRDYLESKTISSASELITCVEENMYHELGNIENYLSYIAERPRVVKEGTHGLFSDLGEHIVLERIKNKINEHQGNVWTTIVSIKKEDAIRLGYDTLSSWQTLIRSKRNEMAKQLKIDPDNFEWYAAFHDESHHPHAHIVMFAKDGRQGYLNEVSIDNLRSNFGREIFKDDLLHIYEQQTEYREQINLASKEYIQERISEINSNLQHNEVIDAKLLALSSRLKEASGKHQYGYLPKGVKKIVDEITNIVSSDKQVSELFDLWHEQRQEVLNTYTDRKEQIRNLADINEFKSIKNAIIKLVDGINFDETINPPVDDYIPLKVETTNSPNIDNKPLSEDIADTEVYIPPLKEIESSVDISSKKENSKSPMPISLSVRLLYHISKMFEHSMLNQTKNYHADKKILQKIKKQKVALGKNPDDTINKQRR